MTYPAEIVNGVMITGLGTPDRQTFTYPPELSQQLRVRGYRVNKTIFYRPGGEVAFLRDVYDMTQHVADISLDLLRQEPWDFFMVVFRDSDEMSHFFWKHMDPYHPAHNPRTDSPYADALLEYYQYLDRLAGELIEAAGPDVNVIIMSDHGLGPLYKDVFLNEWLRQQGLLVTDVNLAQSQGGMLGRFGLTRSNVSSLLQRTGLGPFERSLRSTLGAKINLLPAHNRAVFPDVIDWTRTRCYSYGYHGQLFLNVRGREPLGIVELGREYAELRARIEQLLNAMADPEDGLPVVSQVFSQEQVFHGPYAKEGADLVVVMRDLSYITRHGYEFTKPGMVFTRPNTFESGSHRIDGLLFVSGPDFQAKGELPIYSIMDLAPTILHLLGLPVDRNMEGTVIVDELIQTRRSIRESAYLESTSERAQDINLTEEEEKEVVERLKNLGYLD